MIKPAGKRLWQCEGCGIEVGEYREWRIGGFKPCDIAMQVCMYVAGEVTSHDSFEYLSTCLQTYKLRIIPTSILDNPSSSIILRYNCYSRDATTPPLDPWYSPYSSA